MCLHDSMVHLTKSEKWRRDMYAEANAAMFASIEANAGKDAKLADPNIAYKCFELIRCCQHEDVVLQRKIVAGIPKPLADKVFLKPRESRAPSLGGRVLKSDRSPSRKRSSTAAGSRDAGRPSSKERYNPHVRHTRSHEISPNRPRMDSETLQRKGEGKRAGSRSAGPDRKRKGANRSAHSTHWRNWGNNESRVQGRANSSWRAYRRIRRSCDAAVYSIHIWICEERDERRRQLLVLLALLLVVYRDRPLHVLLWMEAQKLHGEAVG